jgi:hypothetical protein
MKKMDTGKVTKAFWEAVGHVITLTEKNGVARLLQVVLIELICFQGAGLKP